MAELAKLALARSRADHAPEHENQPEAAAQSWAIGYPLRLNDTGQLVEITGATNAELVYALSVLDASTTTDELQRVMLLTSTLEFSASVFHSTAASAITAQTLVGNYCDLTKHTVNGRTEWCVNIETDMNAPSVGASASNLVQITKIAPGQTVGTQYGKVYFRFLNAKTQAAP